jgi:hypothetical protein
MRALIAALVVVAVPVAASAQGPALTGPEIRRRVETHTVPAGAVKEAEDAVRKALGEADSAKFRVVQAAEVAAVRRAPFEEPVDGPISIVCGQFGSPGAGASGYAWFFVAIKRSQVLWVTSDKGGAGPGDAYYSCRGANLTPDSPPQSIPDD